MTVNAGCINYRPAPVPVAETLAGSPPERVWRLHAGRGISAPVVVEGSRAYAGGSDRKVYAIDLDSGDVAWSRRLSGSVLGGVLTHDTVLYVATARPEGRVSALNKVTGRQLWRRSVGEVGAPLAYADGVVLVATRRGDLIALDPSRGRPRWRRRLGSIRAAPVAAEAGAVVVATVDSLFRVSTADGSVTHRRLFGGTTLRGWVPVGNALAAARTDSTVIAIRPADLSTIWEARVDAPLFGAPALQGDTMYAVSRIGTVYRIPPGAGGGIEIVARLRWPVTTGVTLVDGHLVIGGADGVLRGLETDGREAWRIALWRPIDVDPLPLEDGFLAVGGNGDFHRYRR
jgi:outer membrane protein assembly factor BamB